MGDLACEFGTSYLFFEEFAKKAGEGSKDEL